MDNKNTLHSGGCVGADYEFGINAEKAGHITNHYSFHGHKTPCKSGVVILPQHILNMADVHLEGANRWLKRKFPSKWVYVDNLLRRNYYQISHTERIYAVSKLGKRDYVDGGTGWTVMMGILAGVKEIYLFDVDKNHWLKFQGFDQRAPKYIWNDIDTKDIPAPFGRYTGIGMHDLPENGRKAIGELYG